LNACHDALFGEEENAIDVTNKTRGEGWALGL